MKIYKKEIEKNGISPTERTETAAFVVIGLWRKKRGYVPNFGTLFKEGELV